MKADPPVAMNSPAALGTAPIKGNWSATSAVAPVQARRTCSLPTSGATAAAFAARQGRQQQFGLTLQVDDAVGLSERRWPAAADEHVAFLGLFHRQSASRVLNQMLDEGRGSCGRRHRQPTALTGSVTPAICAIRPDQMPAASTTAPAWIDAPSSMPTRHPWPLRRRDCTRTPLRMRAPRRVAALANASVQRLGSALPSRDRTRRPGWTGPGKAPGSATRRGPASRLPGPLRVPARSSAPGASLVRPSRRPSGRRAGSRQDLPAARSPECSRHAGHADAAAGLRPPCAPVQPMLDHAVLKLEVQAAGIASRGLAVELALSTSITSTPARAR